MAIYRVQIGFPADSSLPQDVLQITPHYFGDDAQALADRLKANLIAFTSVGAKPFKIRVYDAQKPPPSYPIATAEQVGTFHTSAAPRELALCLSYFSSWNRPRYRGRLYIPFSLISASSAAIRPTPGQITSALSWKDVLTGSLPAAHNLVVYSRLDNKSYGVTDFWVDDEWDVVRSRGRKPTSRQTAKFP